MQETENIFSAAKYLISRTIMCISNHFRQHSYKRKRSSSNHKKFGFNLMTIGFVIRGYFTQGVKNFLLASVIQKKGQFWFC